jgi:hypothetical protein
VVVIDMPDSDKKIENETKPSRKKYRDFTSVMETMNTKFGYEDGKLSTALDVISWYLTLLTIKTLTIYCG